MWDDEPVAVRGFLGGRIEVFLGAVSIAICRSAKERSEAHVNFAVVDFSRYTGDALWILLPYILGGGSLVGLFEDEGNTHVLLDSHAAALFLKEARTRVP